MSTHWVLKLLGSDEKRIQHNMLMFSLFCGKSQEISPALWMSLLECFGVYRFQPQMKEQIVETLWNHHQVFRQCDGFCLPECKRSGAGGPRGKDTKGSWRDLQVLLIFLSLVYSYNAPPTSTRKILPPSLCLPSIWGAIVEDQNPGACEPSPESPSVKTPAQ